MLTATYTLVALSVEQASLYVRLASFQKFVQSNFLNRQSIQAGQFEYACDTLERLNEACHRRKIELFLIPAIRATTDQADRVLEEMSALNIAASGILRTLKERLRTAKFETEAQVAQVCSAIDAFCGALKKRFESEEKELFPIARSVISGEIWFSIANQFLTHEARLLETRRDRAAGPQRRSRPAPVPAGPAPVSTRPETAAALAASGYPGFASIA
jgi:hemerythrin-like domain-containing protein